MARVGFKIAKYNLHDEEAGKLKALTGNSVPVFEKVIDEKFSPNYANAELYANDGLAEHDDSFIDGALNITIADDEDKFVATIFGQTITTEGEVTSNENDIAVFAHASQERRAFFGLCRHSDCPVYFI